MAGRSKGVEIMALKEYPFDNTYGGVNKKLSSHILPDNVATKMDNWTSRNNGAETVKGWSKFTNQVLTDGAASPAFLTILKLKEFFLNNGNNFLLALTNKTSYFFRESNDLWVPITPGTSVSTTVNVDSPSGAKNLNVVSTTGFAAGDTIIINEGGARQEEAVVDSLAAGPTRIVTLANLGFTHTLAQADAVRRTFGSAIVDADSTAGTTTLNVSHTTQFTVGEAIIVGLGTAREEYLTISSITAGVSLTVARPSWAPSGTGLQYTHTAVQADKVYRVAHLVHSTTTEWDADVDADKLYFTNFVDRVQVWDTTGSPTYSSNLSGLDNCEGLTPGYVVKAKYLRVFENLLVIAHLNENGTTIPNKVRWCRYGTFTSWVNNTDGSGQAGYFTFNNPDFIMGVYQLKRELLFYRDNSIEAATYVGEPDIFSWRRAETGIGLIGHNALVDFGDHHLFVGNDNIYEYNGISAIPIGDEIKKEFFTLLDPGMKEYVRAYLNDAEDEVMITFATSGSSVQNKAFLFNVATRRWSGPRDLDATALGYYTRQSNTTWDSISGTWEQQTEQWDSRVFLDSSSLNLMANNDGLVFQLESGQQADGSDITCVYETKLTDLGSPEIIKRVQKVQIGFETRDTTYDIYVGHCNFEGDTVTWEGPYTLDADVGEDPFIYPDVAGRFFMLRVQTTTRANLRALKWFFTTKSMKS